MISEVARFYGFGHSEIMGMACDDFTAYYRCISKIRAKEMIEQTRIEAYPNMNPKDRKEFVKMLERQTFQTEPSSNQIMSMDDFMRVHE